MSANTYKQFYELYKDRAEIITVYIREAHVVKRNPETNVVESGWPIGHFDYEIEQPLTMTDRVNIVNRFIREFDWSIPTFIDNMENEFDDIYGVWPDRVMLFIGEKMVYRTKLENNGIRRAAFTEQLLPFFCQ